MAKSRISKLIEPYVITKGRKFRLKDIDPGDTGGIKADKAGAEAALAEGVPGSGSSRRSSMPRTIGGCC